MKKFLIISALLIPVIVSAAWWNPLSWFSTINLGATVPFNSFQVGSSPVNGYYLKTDGSVSAWAPVVGGGGSGGGTWATTTSQVANQNINYPLESTDIVVVGSTASTTAKYRFDPNTSTFVQAGNGTTTGNFNVFRENKARNFTATSTTLASIFPYASTTAATIPNAFITNINNLTSNGFVKTSGGNGALSVDTNTYLTGSGAGVTAVSVASANGLAGSSSGGATPQLTLSTTVSGVLVGNGTAISAGVDGTDFTLLNAITCTNQFLRAFTAAGVGTCATVQNTDLANSTISGISLGSNLADLTATNGTLTFSGTYNGSTARNIGLNLASANTWSASTTFQAQTNMNQASTTRFTATNGLYAPYLSDGCVNVTNGLFGSTGSACGAGGGGVSYDWNKQTNFSTLALTPTTTIPIWAKSDIFASSTIKFSPLTTQTTPWTLYADAANGTLTFNDATTTHSLQIGQEQYIVVYNNSGSTITNGQAVYLSGSFAGLSTIALAKADAAATTIVAGLATEDIPNNSTGRITSSGDINGLNTSSFTAGQSLFLSTTTAGALVPYSGRSPFYRYRVGIVKISNASTGAIHVTPSTAFIGNGDVGTVLSINATGNQYFTASSTFKIDPTANNVAIGTTSPFSNKMVTIASSTGSQLSLTDGSATSVQWDHKVIGNSYYISTSSPTTGATSTSAILELRNSGTTALGIATSSPWRTLSVNGTVAFNGLTTASGQNAICINNTTKEIVYAGANTCLSSSIRFKENVETLNPGTALEELSKLRVVTFDYKSENYDKRNEESHSVGLIAEEVEKVDKRLVDYGDDGKPVSLHFERITGLIVQAVQELGARIPETKRSAEENWQWIVMGILACGLLYQQIQIRQFKK